MIPTIRDLDVKDKKVLVRVDFNGPLDDAGRITDDTRIVASLETIEYLLNKGAKAFWLAILADPKEKPIN